MWSHEGIGVRTIRKKRLGKNAQKRVNESKRETENMRACVNACVEVGIFVL